MFTAFEVREFVLVILCIIIGCPVQLIREVFSEIAFVSTHICLALRRWNTFASLWRANLRGDSSVLGVHFSNVFWGLLFVFVMRTYLNSFLKVYYPSSSETQGLTVNFHHEHFIDPTNCPWVSEDVSMCVYWIFQSCLLKMCATSGACINETGLFSSAAVVPALSKSTELCSSANVVPQSKSTAMWSSAAVVQQ